MTTSKELDRLAQEVCHNQLCRGCCSRPAQCMHHVVRRREKMLRWDICNLVPLCFSCHAKVHNGKIKEQDLLPKEVWSYLQQVKNTDYKTWLLQEGMTEKEYLEDCKKKLLKFVG